MNGKEDEDCLFLQHVLDKLYEFDDGPASRQKLKAQKKKKKRKRCEEEEEEEEDESPAVEDICSDAANSPADHQQQQPKTEKTDSTTGQVEVVTFQDPRKKPRTKQTAAQDGVPALQKIAEKEESKPPKELSLEKARLEVHRFGITGYKKEQQRVFEQDRAVMLGARPPKKDYINYRMLQQQIKETKQKAKEEVQPDLKKKKKQNNQRDKKKKVSSGSGSAPTGQVGRFKNGMLILSTKEIQKIKGNKRHK